MLINMFNFILYTFVMFLLQLYSLYLYYSFSLKYIIVHAAEILNLK